MRLHLNLALAALIFALAMLLGPTPGRAITIVCDGGLLDCTPCCGSPACECTDLRRCWEGTINNVVMNHTACVRTGLRFENPTIFGTLLEISYTWVWIIGPGPTVSVTTAFVPPNDVLSIHVDELFPDVPDGAVGTVSYSVSRGSKVSVLTSQTTNCTNYTIDRADSCVE